MSTPNTPRPGPSPASAAADAAARNAEPGDPSEHPALGAAARLLEEAAMVREAADDELDLGALARQAELLTKAHDQLAAALEDAGRG
ncbi:hypothetical protein [Gordonia neofelifaecis]|uniref:Uncharacterized protein n=1 Tax=Gordonia neofelifaecis NRRL B-59395 TaxID=644548 RepID=F1YNH5_9ACTN|nr:hypothetical protein [Gordonia neofelifaecis]EGD53774.1 hypothetical protein SCNU_17595 [Gordonia neofelifaecis NRRL B-59395]